MANGGITLSAEEMRAFSITKHQIENRRKERARRAPRMLFLIGSVLDAEEIAEKYPEVRIVSTSRNLSKFQMMGLAPGVVHGPIQGFRQDRTR